MNIGLISTAHLHVEMYLERLRFLLKGRSIYSVWDDNVVRGSKIAKCEGAYFFDDLSEMLANERLDCFVICAENLHLLPLLREVLPLRKPVFCEKPLAIGLKALSELRQLLKDYDVPVISGYFQPYLGELKAIRTLIDSGELGRVLRVRYRNTRPIVSQRWFDRPGAEWFVDASMSGGGGFLDLGSHAIHCLRSLFGPIAEVSARVGNYSGVYDTVEDFGHALLKFESGLVASVEAGWIQNGGLEGIEVIGSKKSIWRVPAGYVVGNSDSDLSLIVEPDDPVRMDRLLAVVRGQLGEDELKRDLECCFDSIEVLDAAYRASKTGTSIRLFEI